MTVLRGISILDMLPLLHLTLYARFSNVGMRHSRQGETGDGVDEGKETHRVIR